MKHVMFWIFPLVLPQVFSLALHYDRDTKSYKDLLVSISPDVPGRILVTINPLKPLNVESRSDEIISSIKSWITEVHLMRGKRRIKMMMSG